MKSIASTLVLAMTALTLQASAFVLPARGDLAVSVDGREQPVVFTALNLLRSDLQRVLGASMRVTDKGQPQVVVGSLRGPGAERLRATGVDLSWLAELGQAFIVTVTPSGQLVVAGSDAYGTAYGLVELTRLMGVSPWEWWADVEPAKLESFSLPEGFMTRQHPDVTYRGLCVSDAEWGFLPWVQYTFEPNTALGVGPKTARRVFELMMRLRGNLFWPSKDEKSQAYFATTEARTLARNYGIFLGQDAAQPITLAGSDAAMPRIFEDDGYGYLRSFPSQTDVQAQGGCGIYYHASYRGAPHDYLWLGTASPFLMYQQLTEAYYHGAYRLWMLNAGDIKPAEYQVSLFMDMAWDIDSVRQLTVGRHLEEFYAQTVARDVARLTSIYMKEFYHLAFQCKPEHLAGTRVDETDAAWNQVRDLPWSEARIRHRLGRYDLMQRNILWLADSVRRTHFARYDAFFQLVEYPVLATVAQNEKYLCAQLARHGRPYLQRDDVAATWMRSAVAHNRVQELTLKYNAHHGNKWQGIMSSNPRELQVFQPVPQVQATTPLPTDPTPIATFYGASYNASSFTGGDVLDPVLGLGASIRAMPVPKDCNVTYKYKHNYGKAKVARVEIHMLPTHPIEAQQRFTLSLDGGAPMTFTYDTEVGSEEWKQNVLRNYAVVVAQIPVVKAAGEHSLVLSALDDGVVVDEVFIWK